MPKEKGGLLRHQMARSRDGSLKSPGDDGRPSVFVHTRRHVCQAAFPAQTFLEGWKDTASTSTHSGTLSRKRTKRSPSCSQTRCIQGTSPSLLQEHSAHSLTSGLNNMPGRPGGPRWAVSVESLSWHSARCKALSRYVPGLPFVSLLSSQTKRTNATVHEFMPPCLQKEKFMVNYLARIQFKKK